MVGSAVCLQVQKPSAPVRRWRWVLQRTGSGLMPAGGVWLGPLEWPEPEAERCIGAVGDVCACSVYGCARVAMCVNCKKTESNFIVKSLLQFYSTADAMDDIK